MSAIIEFEDFMKNARWGQPLHRGMLASVDSMAPVTKECDPQHLVMSLALQKERGLEALRGHAPAPQMAPSFGPGGTQMSAMPNLNLNNFSPAPPKGGSEN